MSVTDFAGVAIGQLGLIGLILIHTETAAQLKAAIEEGTGGGSRALVLDVRNRGEYESGHINGALNIPVDELRHDGLEAESLYEAHQRHRRLYGGLSRGRVRCGLRKERRGCRAHW
jgi:predicted sulfurtransferase